MKKPEFCGSLAAGNFAFLRPVLFLAFIGLFLSACIVREGSGEKLAEVDNSLVTGSIKRLSPAQLDPKLVPDSAAILDKFALLEKQGARRKTLGWENAPAGSRGVISALGQAKNKAGGNGGICRSFQTTRESFDGIALYKGEACKYGQSPWALSALREE